MKILEKLFCKHDYEQINQVVMESEYDMVVNSFKIPNTHLSLTRKLITDYKCNKCGKIKRFIEKTA